MSVRPHIARHWVGRREPLAQVLRWLRAPTEGRSPLCVSGPAGAGKSALLARALEEWGEQREVCWCDLSGCGEAHELRRELSAALALAEVAPHLESLGEVVRAREDALVVLDAAEGVSEVVARWIEGWPEEARGRLVVIARHAALSGAERVALEGLSEEEAKALFLAHAPGSVEEEDEGALEALLAAMDRLPYFVILAASRREIMSSSRMLRGWRDAREAALWHDPQGGGVGRSWEVLTPEERALLSSSAVFARSFTLEAACQVLCDDPAALFVCGEALSGLVRHALLRCMAAEGERRFALYGSVASWLEMSHAPSEAVKRRHAEWYEGELAARRVHVRGAGEEEAARWCEAERHEIERAVGTWEALGEEVRALRMCLNMLCFLPSVWSEGALDRIERGAARADAALEVRRWTQLGEAYAVRGRLEEAREVMTRAMSLIATGGEAIDEVSRLEAALTMGRVWRDRGELERAEQVWAAASREARQGGQVGHELLLIARRVMLALNLSRQGRASGSSQAEVEAWLMGALSQRHRVALEVRHALIDARALWLHEQGRTRQARQLLEEILPQRERSPHHELTVSVIAHTAALAYFEGEFERALSLSRHASEVCERHGLMERQTRELASQGLYALAGGELEQAEQVLLRAEELAAIQRQQVTRLIARVQLMMLYHERDMRAEASRWHALAEALAQSLGSRGHQGLIALWGTLAMSAAHPEAQREAMERALSELASSSEYAAPEAFPRHDALRHLFTALLGMQRAEWLMRQGEVEASREHVERARLLLSEPPWRAVLGERAGHLELAWRLLQQRHARFVAQHAVPESSATEPLVTLRVGPEGEWFMVGSGERVMLSGRETLRRIFWGIVTCWRPAPATSQLLSVDEVVACGWPGERIEPMSATNRVYASIRLLRKLGLRDVLLTSEGGYMLDPRVHVVQVEEEGQDDTPG